MIQPNELRIGNMVKGGIITRIQEQSVRIKYMNAGNMYMHSLVHYHIIEPIPLTEEWLLKFGFEKKPAHKNKYSEIRDYVIKISEDQYFVIRDETDLVYKNVSRCVLINSNWFHGLHGSDSVLYPKIDFVHQLQNLFYILIGKEL